MITSSIGFDTKRLRVSEITQEHLVYIRKGFNNPEIMAYFHLDSNTKKHFCDTVIVYPNEIQNPNEIWLSVIVKDTNDFIGIVGLHEINWDLRKVELSYWSFPEFWNKGFHREVFINVITYAENELAIDGFEIYVDKKHHYQHNRTYNLLGFKQETELNSQIIPDKGLIDYVIYSRYRTTDQIINKEQYKTTNKTIKTIPK